MGRYPAGFSANPLAKDFFGGHDKALEIGSLQILSSFIIQSDLKEFGENLFPKLYHAHQKNLLPKD